MGADVYLRACKKAYTDIISEMRSTDAQSVPHNVHDLIWDAMGEIGNGLLHGKLRLDNRRFLRDSFYREIIPDFGDGHGKEHTLAYLSECTDFYQNQKDKSSPGPLICLHKELEFVRADCVAGLPIAKEMQSVVDNFVRHVSVRYAFRSENSAGQRVRQGWYQTTASDPEHSKAVLRTIPRDTISVLSTIADLVLISKIQLSNIAVVYHLMCAEAVEFQLSGWKLLGSEIDKVREL